MRWWVAAGMAATLAACAPWAARRAAPGDAIGRLPVLLVLEGDASSGSDAAHLAGVLSDRIGRPVVTATASAADAEALAARLGRRYGRAPRGAWASDRCALGEAAVEALAHDATAHYRLVLRRRATTRPATRVERDDPSVNGGRTARLLGALGLADRGHVDEVRLDGELIATTFGQEAATTRLRIAAADRAPVTPIGGASLDVAEVVGRAIEGLAPPPYPLWDALARRLLGRGCSLAALAVYDARLRHRPASRDVLRAALGSDDAPAPAAAPVAIATPGATPGVEPGPTCQALCELHMVELCNNDRELWTLHHAEWQATPCGQRRLEPFLRECYQRQWLMGTLQEACIAPCRRADDGRARLLHLLQAEGCMRVPPT